MYVTIYRSTLHHPIPGGGCGTDGDVIVVVIGVREGRGGDGGEGEGRVIGVLGGVTKCREKS